MSLPAPPGGAGSVPRIETARLLLRPFQYEDWRAVHSYNSDPEVVRFVPGEYAGEGDSQEAVAAWMQGLEDTPPHYDFAVTVRPEPFVIGWCCLHSNPEHERWGELKYVFNRGFWGQGYATEAGRAVLEFAFADVGLQRVYATCRPENQASWRVLEKLGMQREAHLRQHVWYRGAWHDSYLYARLASEWGSQAQADRQVKGG